MRVALADDHQDVLDFMTSILEEMDHRVVTFPDGERLSQGLMRDTFDLVILDWNMPKKDGLAVLNWMQDAIKEAPPVIMMTSRTAKNDITAALNAGADDYITKPEDRNVISARIAAMLRRSSNSGSFETKAVYGKYTLDRIEHKVLYDDKEVTLTAKEFELIDLLFRNRDRTMSRDYIMETIWRTNAALTTRTLDMHISRVRSKLNLKPENGFRIFTVFGYGYRLETLS